MMDPGSEHGVSVIIGTLILVLITVTAAAGLAIMVSQLQKDEMDRQSHLAAVNGENIRIAAIGLLNDRAAWNTSPYNISVEQPWENWSSVTLTLVNLNTDEARIIGIAINNHYSRNITAIGETPAGRQSYNISDNEFLSLPGTKSQTLQVNFTDDFTTTQYLPVNDPVRVRVMTSLYNTFDKTFRTPYPVIGTQIETEDLGVTERDVIVLDGSGSTADNAVVRWDWLVLDRGKAVTVDGSAWNDAANITNASGKVVRLNPMTAGPFGVKLRVTDDAGMTQFSAPVEIPANNRFIPPSNLNAVFDPAGSEIRATVRDINGNPLPDLVVNFMIGSNPFGNLTLDRYYNTTDITGGTLAKCTSGNGTVKVIYGKLSPIELPVSAP